MRYFTSTEKIELFKASKFLDSRSKLYLEITAMSESVENDVVAGLGSVSNKHL